MDKSVCDLGGRFNQSLCEFLESECDTRYYFLAHKLYCSPPASPKLLLAIFSCGTILCLLILVSSIGIISSKYLLHSVTNLTEALCLKRESLSYIVIPILNGTPDVVNAHLMIRSKSISLVMGQIIGANLISFTFIVGCITILKPFPITNKREMMSGYCFVGLTILILSYVLLDGRITILECVLLTLLYPINILIGSYDQEIEPSSADLERSLAKDLVLETTHLLNDRGSTEMSEDTPRSFESRPKMSVLQSILLRLHTFGDHFYFALIPTSRSSLSHPVMTATALKSRMMSSQLFGVWLIIWSTVLLNYSLLDFPLRILPYLVGISLISSSVFVKLFSPTICDLLINIACVFNSLTLLTLISKGLICLLKNTGVMWQISDYIMGLLVFSLANCLSDILINIQVALTYSPTLGIKACMSSCCLLISIGIGFNGLWDLSITALKAKEFSFATYLPVMLTWELYTSLIALNLTVISSVAYMVFNDWRLDKTLGIGLIGLWIVASTACILIEIK